MVQSSEIVSHLEDLVLTTVTWVAKNQARGYITFQASPILVHLELRLKC